MSNPQRLNWPRDFPCSVIERSTVFNLAQANGNVLFVQGRPSMCAEVDSYPDTVKAGIAIVTFAEAQITLAPRNIGFVCEVGDERGNVECALHDVIPIKVHVRQTDGGDNESR